MSTSENTNPNFVSTYDFVTAAEAAEWWAVSASHWRRLARQGKVPAPIDLQRAGEVNLWSVEDLVGPLDDRAEELLAKHYGRAVEIKQVVNDIFMQDAGRRAENRKRACPHRKQDAEAKQWFDEWFDELDYRYGVATTSKRKMSAEGLVKFDDLVI